MRSEPSSSPAAGRANGPEPTTGTMKAVVRDRYGDTKVLHLDEVPRPARVRPLAVNLGPVLTCRRRRPGCSDEPTSTGRTGNGSSCHLELVNLDPVEDLQAAPALETIKVAPVRLEGGDVGVQRLGHGSDVIRGIRAVPVHQVASSPAASVVHLDVFDNGDETAGGRDKIAVCDRSLTLGTGARR